MATKKQKEELIEALKAEKQKFKVHLTGYGGEIVLGHISEEQYEFWRDREDLSDFVDDWDGEMDIPDEMKMFSNGGWYECDDLAHENGCEFSSACWVTVYDENDDTVFECPLDYASLEERGVFVEGMLEDEFRVRLDTDAKYYFLGQNFEKGTFQTYEIEDYKFDPTKLNFHIHDIEGWCLVTGVSYQSQELEDTGGYSTTGKGCEYRVCSREE